MISATARKTMAGHYAAVLYAASVIMELCWLSAILLLVNDRTGYDLFVPWVLLIYLISFIFNILIKGFSWPKIVKNTINWLAWLLVMLISVKLIVFNSTSWGDAGWILSLLSSIPRSIYGVEPGLLLLLYSLLMWWPAKWLACRSISFSTCVIEFQFGLVILILISVIGSVAGADSRDSIPVALRYTIPITVTFFVVGLIGISLAHTLEGKRWSGGLSKSQWTWLVIVSTGIILVIGLVIAFVISPGLLKAIIDGAGWVIMQIMFLLSLLARLLPSGDVNIPPPDSVPMTANTTEMKDIFQIPEDVRLWMNVIWAVIFVSFLVVAIWQISSQLLAWIRRRALARGGSIEPLKGAFKADLLALFYWIGRKITRLLSLLFKRGKAGISKSEASVAILYRRLLKWGARKGYTRNPAQTPNEYLERLLETWPQAAIDLSLITESFVRTCYGKAAPTKAELHDLNESWKRISQNRYTRQAGKPA